MLLFSESSLLSPKMTTTCPWARQRPDVNLWPSNPENSRAAGPQYTSPKGHLRAVLAVPLNEAVPLHQAPDPPATKMGQQRVPKLPRELKVVAGDGGARRRYEGKMGRARVNDSLLNTRISSISTAQRKKIPRSGLGPGKGSHGCSWWSQAPAHGAPSLGSPRNFSRQEGCGLR